MICKLILLINRFLLGVGFLVFKEHFIDKSVRQLYNINIIKTKGC